MQLSDLFRQLSPQLALVEVPRERREKTLVAIDSVHIGAGSQEIWLLVRPVDEYPADELPA